MKRTKLGAKLGACVAALGLMGATAAEAQIRGRNNCATAAEISAVQISAVQQELTDAALACGPVAVANFNRFQTIFNKELRASDARMLRMFKRLHGARGDREYDAYKTRAIANADLRRTKPGQHDNFCRSANIVFAAALAPDKPVLEDFVSGVPVNEPTPVNGCEISVAITFQGVQAGPSIAPIPRPSLAGDPPNPVY